MGKLNEFARTYEPPKTKNVADLKEVNTDIDLKDGESKDENGETFKYKYVTVDGEDYRVPNSVISALKSILEKKPDLKKFSVSKMGQGFNTRYTVIPIE